MAMSLDNTGFIQGALDVLFAGNRGRRHDRERRAREGDHPGPATSGSPATNLLSCGDARAPPDVRAVRDGARADAVVTTRHVVSYVGKTADALAIEDGGSEGRGLLLKGFPSLYAYVFPGRDGQRFRWLIMGRDEGPWAYRRQAGL
jgi:hypothetical protein